jgi:ureidoglycolate lyase
MRLLEPEPLTADAFAGFGDVVQTGEAYELINRGMARQFADLAMIDVAADGGSPRVSIYRARPHELPLTIAMLERHPLSSQFFMPLHGEPFLIVVAPAGENPDASAMRAFVTNGRQGINYHRGTWHHPLIAVRDQSEFLVVDRAGCGRNCDEFFFNGDGIVLRPPA